MHFYYSEEFDLALPEGHRFPGAKYGLLKNKLLEDKILTERQLVTSMAADDKTVLFGHTFDYISRLSDGSMDRKDMRRIGFPWSPKILHRGRKTVGGAVAAAKTALKYGLSGQLAGGTHHAHRDFGAGFCILNDFAIVANLALHENWCERIAIVDLDVHQGDGNAAILLEDGHCPRGQIFILDVFGEKNFPFRKVPSSLDVPLPDHIEDMAYLQAVEAALPDVWAFKPDLVLYQAGVDPLMQDRLGRMNISYEGLMQRDRLVLEGCWRRGIPVSMAIGGGYSDPIDATVQAYANTYNIAKSLYGF